MAFLRSQAKNKQGIVLMAKIILMRHGKPELDFDGSYGRWLSSNAMARLIDAYQDARLAEPFLVPDDTLSLAHMADYAFTSPLARSFESLVALRLDVEFLADPVFAEASMPAPALPSFLGRLPLPVIVWSALLRLFWWLGLMDGKESYQRCQLRAERAVHLLQKQFLSHDTLFLSGHGFFNHMLIRALKRHGWTVTAQKSGSRPGYWSCVLLEKTQTST